MSQVIKNQATITYNNNQTENTCIVPTRVYEGIGVHKLAITSEDGLIEPDPPEQGQKVSEVVKNGMIGADGIVTYRIEVFNPLPESIYDVVVEDYLVGMPTGTTVVKTNPVNTGTFPELIFNLREIGPESYATIVYTIKLPEPVQQGYEVSNQATINYKNFSGDEENPVGEAQEPQLTEKINLMAVYADIDAVKEAPEAVVEGENFKYNLSFENKGQKTAAVSQIIDYLPLDFVPDTTNPVVITLNGNPLTEGTAYSYTIEAGTNPQGDNVKVLKIVPINNGLDIPADGTLVVVVSGSVN